MGIHAASRIAATPMYASYFGLDDVPFSITPNPRYLYLSGHHAEALAHLLYGVTESGGFIQLTGEVGTGKTTLVRCLLEQLPEHVDVALILNPHIELGEFLHSVCAELGIEHGDADSTKTLVDRLNRHLLDAHARGRRVVLLVDEAQALPIDVLEQIRLLTNLETESQKLLQIVLVGQPELRSLLARQDLRQLAQRITARYHLAPLDVGEAAAYIHHRLEVAGASGPIFTPGAIRRIHKLAGGIPRLINILCDRALTGAYAQESRQVDARLARRAGHEVLGTEARPVWPWAVASLAGLAIAAVLVWGLVRAPAATSATSIKLPVSHVAGTDSLADWLQATAVNTDTDTAFATLFSRWGISYKPGATLQACQQADAAGLRCLYRRGTWNNLRSFDRPAIITLQDAAGTAHQVVVTAIEGGSVTLAAGADQHAYALSDLDRHWYGEYLLLWRPPAQAPRTLQQGMQGPGVIWLRTQLAHLEGAVGGGGDVYDDDLAELVRDFQRSHHLKVDGIAGDETLIQINTALGTPGIPTLTQAAR